MELVVYTGTLVNFTYVSIANMATAFVLTIHNGTVCYPPHYSIRMKP